MTVDLTKDRQRWLDELVVELRLLDVDGRAIGDAVASAREFLVDAQVPAEQAFGSPREYAQELDLRPQARGDGLRRTVVVAAVDVLGFLAFVFAAGPAWRGERFDLDTGTAVLVLTVIVLVLLTPRMLPVVLRATPWRIGLGAAAVFAFQVAVVFQLGDVRLVSMPAWPLAVLGMVVLIASLVRAWRTRAELDDPVVDPLGPGLGDRDTSRSSRLVLLPQVVTFVAAWCFVLLDVLIGH